MAQVTWRAGEDLVRRVQNAAARGGRSMNEFLTLVLDAATDPAAVGDEAARVRERLIRANLLAADSPGGEPVDPAALAAARRRAGHGASLVDLVIGDRE